MGTHLGTSPGQLKREARTKPSRSTCDNGDFALEGWEIALRGIHGIGGEGIRKVN